MAGNPAIAFFIHPGSPNSARSDGASTAAIPPRILLPSSPCDLQKKVVADTIGRYGERDEETLEARAKLAVWTGLSGDPIAARDMLARLHAIRAEVSGPDHPRTLVMAAKLAD